MKNRVRVLDRGAEPQRVGQVADQDPNTDGAQRTGRRAASHGRPNVPAATGEFEHDGTSERLIGSGDDYGHARQPNLNPKFVKAA